MSARRTKFYLDKQNGKFMGVCAGIADYTGIDVVWVRVAMFLSFFIIGWTLLAYFAIGVIADNKPSGLYADRDDEKFWQGVRANPARSRSEEHTSELQSLMRISYAVFCLKKKKEYSIQNLLLFKYTTLLY